MRELDEEGFRFALWLDAERSSCFFARKIIICEGATEKALLDYLLDNQWVDLSHEGLYVLDALGKYNIHRFMGLFGALGIPHCVLFDGDSNKNVHQYINEFIKSKRNEHTLSIDNFPVDLETELGLSLPKRNDLKPLMALKAIVDGSAESDKIEKLHERIAALIIIGAR